MFSEPAMPDTHFVSAESRPSSAPPASSVVRPSILYFGTPVVLVTTVSTEGHANISPMSSAWALGDRVVLGMGTAGQGCENLLATREAVINLPGPGQCEMVEAIAATTGSNPVPEYKVAMGYRFEADKFARAGMTALPSETIAPPRIAECPMQLEARLLAAHEAARVEGEDAGFWMLEMQVTRVHAHENIVVPGTQYIDTREWSPLLYVFRHYFGTGERLGRNFRAET